MLSLNNNLLFMKSLQPLKTLINFLFIIICVVFTGISIALFYVALSGNLEFLSIEANSQIEIFSKIITLILVFALQVMSIYYLREFIKDVSPQNLFTIQQIKWLSKTGKLMILATIVYTALNFLMKVIFENRIEISVLNNSENLFYNEIFLLIIGLFFLFLSHVFNSARILKEENELTI